MRFTPDYPSYLEPQREMVLAAAQATALYPAINTGRLAVCNGYGQQCHSLFCLSCSKAASFRLKRELHKLAAGLDTNDLRFATFNSPHISAEEIRITTQEVGIAAKRMMFRHAGLSGAYLRTEISKKPEGYMVHAHALLDTLLGYMSGRKAMSKAKWESDWQIFTQYPLHSMQTPVHVRRIKDAEDLKHVCGYITKSPWASLFDAEALRDPARLEGAVDSVIPVPVAIDATRRLAKHRSWGTLKI